MTSKICSYEINSLNKIMPKVISYSKKLWWQNKLADLADKASSTNVFPPIILTTENTEQIEDIL